MRLLPLLFLATTALADLTPSERELIQQLGPDTPEPILLWPDKPPQFLENAAPEVMKDNQTIQSVSVPTITPCHAKSSTAPSGPHRSPAPGWRMQR